MVIHKLNGVDDGLVLFVSVLCGSSVMNRKRVSSDNKEITCKKCIKLLNKEE